ncbi:unnamed protein product [Linum trigynum]|uniref:Uncharacterized protein n=1 Tax=Linum trigynum TaxID=586398 RepID=A0AAV2GFK2_9ROSI
MLNLKALFLEIFTPLYLFPPHHHKAQESDEVLLALHRNCRSGSHRSMAVLEGAAVSTISVGEEPQAADSPVLIEAVNNVQVATRLLEVESEISVNSET